VTKVRTSWVETPEFPRLLGMAKQVADESKKGFLQGLKPVGFGASTPGLKPRPPKEKSILRSL